MRADPRVRKDGRCSVCRKSRKPERSRKYARGQADKDPFCSTVCARQWHGTSLPETNFHRAQQKLAQEAA